MKRLARFLPYVIIGVGFCLTLWIVLASRRATDQSNAQTRAISCVLFINAKNRSQDQIERCIAHIQQQTGEVIFRDDKAVRGVK